MRAFFQLMKLLIGFPRASLLAILSLFIAMQLGIFFAWFDAPFKIGTVIFAFGVGAVFDFRNRTCVITSNAAKNKGP